MARYAITIFLGAFLLFQVQPLVGKFILPWFGGAAGVWSVCLVFFQSGLLAGYLYAHLVTTRLSRRRQVLVHAAVLAASMAMLPIMARAESWKPVGDQSPTGRILLLLLVQVGLPYFVLATTGPLLQAWFHVTAAGRSPYRLYALSNAGSLLALLTYPFAVEPWVTLRVQTWMWSGAYLTFVAGCGWCCWRLLQFAGTSDEAAALDEPVPLEPAPAASPDGKPSASIVALWTALAAMGSVMLLATTNQVCQESFRCCGSCRWRST